MRLKYILLTIASCCVLLGCDNPTNSSNTSKKVEAAPPCPLERAIKAEIDQLATAERSARTEIVARIHEKLSAVRGVGFDREDVDGFIIMKPACRGTRYPDIRLVSTSELFLLLGE